MISKKKKTIKTVPEKDSYTTRTEFIDILNQILYNSNMINPK